MQWKIWLLLGRKRSLRRSWKKKPKKKTDKKIEEKIEDDLDLGMQFGDGDVGDLKRTVSLIGDGMYVEEKEKMMEEFVKRLSQFAGPSDHRKDINLNKAIFQAQTAEDVLDVTYEVIVEVAKGLSPSPLSPLNIAIALHRIAKNMERVSMMKTRRLAFAQQREMSMLVGIAMTALPECSDQLSTIAWSYAIFGEMDRSFFSYVWKNLSQFEEQRISELYREDMMFASHLHLVNQCLKLEFPHLQLLLCELEDKVDRAGKTKRFNQKIISSFQKEVGRLLVSTRLEWVK